MKYGSVIALLLVVSLLAAACAPLVTTGQPTPEPQPMATPVPQEPAAPALDIVDTAVSAGSFNTLVAAVQAAGLVDALKGDGPFTVFAPTDEAFAAVPAETLEALLADPETLSQVLLYHVLSGRVLAESVADGLSANTLQGAPVAFSIMGGQPMINDANIIATDVLASNGVIHVIDRVILPPAETAEEPTLDIVDTAVAAGSFDTLVAAVQAAGLVDALKGDGPFTVFAPTDEAFAAIPADMLAGLLADPDTLGQILLYHVLPGKVMAESVADGLTVETLQGAPVTFSVMNGQPMINDAAIIATDIETSNGVIHVIDAVILPPAEAAAEDSGMAMDIVDTAISTGNFETLVAALQAAGLEDALRGEGPLTVFAPTDDAFAKLPAGTLESLLANPEALTDILLYHVVDGRLDARTVVEHGFVTTLLGRPLAVTALRDGVRINDANVVAADVEASNGIIHVIDTVLVPAGN